MHLAVPGLNDLPQFLDNRLDERPPIPRLQQLSRGPDGAVLLIGQRHGVSSRGGSDLD